MKGPLWTTEGPVLVTGLHFLRQHNEVRIHLWLVDCQPCSREPRPMNSFPASIKWLITYRLEEHSDHQLKESV